jgi:hypothetical protein
VILAYFQAHPELEQGWRTIDVPLSVRVWADHMPDGAGPRRDDALVTLRYDRNAGR